MAAPVPPAPQNVCFAVNVDWDAKKFVLNPREKPTPGPGELLLKVSAAALNPVDAKSVNRKGMLKDPDSFVPGVDTVGIVEAVGEGVTTPAVGARVMYHGNMAAPRGGFSTYSLADASMVVDLATTSPAVQAQSDVTLAAIPCAGWTAYQVVHDKLHVTSGDSVLVWGATGGVGGFLVQYARAAGATQVIAVASAKNEAYARSLGATDFIDYSIGNKAVEKAVMDLTGGVGVTKAADLVGAESAKSCAAVLDFAGVLCPVVSTGDFSSVENPFGRAIVIAQVALGMAHRFSKRARDALVSTGRAATEAAIAGKFKIDVTRTLTLAEVPDALSEMLNAHTRGKLVVKME